MYFLLLKNWRVTILSQLALLTLLSELPIEIGYKNELDTGLFSIQSYTATHPDLTKIKDYQYTN